MNCQWTHARLSAYVDGELGGAETLRLREHLRSCPGCAREVEDLRSIKAMLGTLSEPEPVAGFEERLVAAVFAAPAPRRAAGFRFTWVAASAMAAAAATFLILQLIAPSPSAPNAQPTALDIRRDQMLTAGFDPLGGSSPIVTVSNGGR